MEKVYVKLKDKGTVFHDFTQGLKVIGIKPVEADKTEEITKALNRGILVKLTKEEYNKELSVYNKAKEAAVVDEKKELEAKALLKGKAKVAVETKPAVEPKKADAPKLEDTGKPAGDDATKGDDAPKDNAGDALKDDAPKDYSMWTNDQLKEELTKRGIDFTKAKNKAEYTALLIVDDEK